MTDFFGTIRATTKTKGLPQSPAAPNDIYARVRMFEDEMRATGVLQMQHGVVSLDLKECREKQADSEEDYVTVEEDTSFYAEVMVQLAVIWWIRTRDRQEALKLLEKIPFRTGQVTVAETGGSWSVEKPLPLHRGAFGT